ncbi:hypothetical protein ACFXKC_33010 [Streptomyces sp. NPDC059340]|uniref:hypothetical protein n=1 Tax=Streptomyces sp. NPDC059340 TaxID=3346806 RepID=UPI00369B11D1
MGQAQSVPQLVRHDLLEVDRGDSDSRLFPDGYGAVLGEQVFDWLGELERDLRLCRGATDAVRGALGEQLRDVGCRPDGLGGVDAADEP